MKTTTSLLAIVGAATFLLVGCQTPNEQSSAPFPIDYKSIVHSYVAKTFKDPDSFEWRTVSFPRQGSLWRGILFGGAAPCWLVDVTLNTKNSSEGYVEYQTFTIYIKNDQVIGSHVSYHSERPVMSVGRGVSFEKLLKMPPFTATVEAIDFDHPFFMRKTSIEIQLKKPNATMRLFLQSYPANQTIIGFAHSLHEGESYVFPQVFVDYVNSQTNRLLNTVLEPMATAP